MKLMFMSYLSKSLIRLMFDIFILIDFVFVIHLYTVSDKIKGVCMAYVMSILGLG